MSKMQSVVLCSTQQFEIEERERVNITKPTEVLVKTKAVGVCGSDIEAWHGKHAHVTMPAVLGHEVVGEVVAIGDDVKNICLGDRVVLEPIEYCGTCYACRRGQHNVCKDLAVRGFKIDGGLQQYFVADESKLHKFSSDIDWEIAVMLEPYTIAAQVYSRASITEGDVVLVHGLGPAGICIADWAKYKGCTVIASDMVGKRLELAREFGIDYVVNPKETNIKELVAEITKGEGVNVVVEACGVNQLVTEAFEITSPAARIVPISFNFSVPTNFLSGLLNAKEISVIGSRLQSGQFPVVIREFEKHSDNIKKLVTHKFPFTQTNEAYTLAASRSPDVGKVVVMFE